jgi:hypothetical protein
MLKVFIGYDCRQPVSYNVLQHSIISQSSQPVAIIPLVIEQLPIHKKLCDIFGKPVLPDLEDGNGNTMPHPGGLWLTGADKPLNAAKGFWFAVRGGLTPFTFTRFLVPYLCNYEGWALFLDIDMLLKDDISKLFALADDKYAVMVSKNVKRFEWASAMLFNCAKCKILTPEFVENAQDLHGIAWANEEEIGALPPEWNHLVGYDLPRDDAKLVHYTQGVPCFPETAESEYKKEWMIELKACNSAAPWDVLMGGSVHAAEVGGKMMPKFTVEPPK